MARGRGASQAPAAASSALSWPRRRAELRSSQELGQAESREVHHEGGRNLRLPAATDRSMTSPRHKLKRAEFKLAVGGARVRQAKASRGPLRRPENRSR